MTSTLGKGSVFRVELPLERVQEELESLQPKQQRDFENTRVILAEDNPLNYKMLNLILKKMKIETLWAKDGHEVLELLHQPHDFILMDIQMPNMDGLECTKILREEKQYRQPIIAVTANAFQENIYSYLAAGMDEVINKPIDVKKLHELLDRLISKN